MRIELEEVKKETEDSKEQKEIKVVPVSIEAPQLTLFVYARDGIGSSGRLHKGG